GFRNESIHSRRPGCAPEARSSWSSLTSLTRPRNHLARPVQRGRLIRLQKATRRAAWGAITCDDESGFSDVGQHAKSAAFEAREHAAPGASKARLFPVKVLAERIFVVADSIQSLLDLFDIKPCSARSAVGRGPLFTNSKFRRKTGKGYG